MRDTLFVASSERLSRLGSLGEELATERLRATGFSGVENLNRVTANNIFAEVVAYRHGERYLISINARNRLTQAGRLNASYNLVKIRDVKNRILKERGLSTDAITSLLIGEVAELAQRASATPARVTVSIDASLRKYDCFFGLVSELGARRSIPMTIPHLAKYECLARNIQDHRITNDLINASD